ncbi:SgcJ/EcaC family oxidoreductase [Kribbella pittospori]|uniref:SgcJ/EcaC family oxidoreductase n=1 Tax=Kribbella pittospori TaxID=722689 RepID=A0A4R0KIB1_9ACTN|nr:SgcJ/EcaC family oxidoreductase [Kribbella pittospori]TCC60321.1 SgcJ/EcaC family oxidoreductase [Kribbella pittospori]
MRIEGAVPSQADVDAIVALVAKVQEVQGNEDVDGFISLFRKDAVWVTGHGKRLYGRDTIEAFTREVLPGAMKDSSATYEPDHLLFVRPDIAVVNVNQTYVERGGTTGSYGSPVYFLARDGSDWEIAAAQNTVVVEAD